MLIELEQLKVRIRMLITKTNDKQEIQNLHSFLEMVIMDLIPQKLYFMDHDENEHSQSEDDKNFQSIFSQTDSDIDAQELK